MRLPRRVPWASSAQLDELCAAIYSDQPDPVFAVNRLAAWNAVAPLPHALDATLALLVVKNSDLPSANRLLLRHAYAAAIIRLVNGLVDPLQVGTYARPIRAIAAQLRLPLFLVELRHAATHEHLPSLHLLREGATQSMSWLFHNYYFPTLNPSQITQTHQSYTPPPRSLLPLLKLYKTTIKSIARDASLIHQMRPKLLAILRDIERWIAECKVAANTIGGAAFHSPVQDDDVDPKEAWALEQFSQALTTKGILVPLAKKKRQKDPNEFLPNKESLAFWETLLKHVQAIHSDFPHILCRTLASRLLNLPEGERLDPTYNLYLAYWTMWTVQKYGDDSQVDIRRDILSKLIQGLYSSSSSPKNQTASLALLQELTSGQAELEALVAVVVRPPSQISKSAWQSDDLDVMKERYDLLQSALDKTVPETSELALPAPSSHPIANQPPDLPAGWQLLEHGRNWQPCPMGEYFDKGH